MNLTNIVSVLVIDCYMPSNVAYFTNDVEGQKQAKDYFVDCMSSCHSVTQKQVEQGLKDGFYKFSDGYSVWLMDM